jgi:hypothetical protein
MIQIFRFGNLSLCFGKPSEKDLLHSSKSLGKKGNEKACCPALLLIMEPCIELVGLVLIGISPTGSKSKCTRSFCTIRANVRDRLFRNKGSEDSLGMRVGLRRVLYLRKNTVNLAVDRVHLQSCSGRLRSVTRSAAKASNISGDYDVILVSNYGRHKFICSRGRTSNSRNDRQPPSGYVPVFPERPGTATKNSQSVYADR